MVLRFFRGFTLMLASLLSVVSFCQDAPRLVFADQSVKIINLDNDVLTTIIRQHWRDDDWSEAFRIYTWHAHQNQIHQPLAGYYSVEGMVVYFTPLFPFAAGETYYAELDCGRLWKKSGGLPVGSKLSGGTGNIDLIFTIPAAATGRSFVEAVYPASDSLPANLLRMYIHFSAPMSTGEAYQHIQLKDESGHIVEKSFLIVDQELWDIDRRRFTLLFDPGRIKRGIQSNIDLGTPLQPNHIYRLVIDSSWRDEHGNALSGKFEKRIVVTAPEREKLSSQYWKVIAPEASAKGPLVLQFPRPVDHALAIKYIVITDSFNNVLEGKTMMGDDDRTWAFYPDKPWTGGHYALQISPYLEDPAGNNFNNPFDIDLSVAKRVDSDEPIVISFVVKQEMN